MHVQRTKSAVDIRKLPLSGLAGDSDGHSHSSAAAVKNSRSRSPTSDLIMPAFIDDPVTHHRAAVPAHVVPVPTFSTALMGLKGAGLYQVSYKAIVGVFISDAATNNSGLGAPKRAWNTLTPCSVLTG